MLKRSPQIEQFFHGNKQSLDPKKILYLQKNLFSNVLMIFVCKLPINKIKGYLFSILSLSGPSSGSPYRVCQIMVLIKTVSKTKCLYSIYVVTRKEQQNGFTFKKKKNFKLSENFYNSKFEFGQLYFVYYPLCNQIKK